MKTFLEIIRAWTCNEEPRPKKTNLEVSMVPMGQARDWKHISHPFEIRRGKRSLDLQVDEAEWLVAELTKMLARPDVRRPIKIEVELKGSQP